MHPAERTALPPPPVDPRALREQARRIRGRRRLGALFTVAILVVTGVSVWFLSSGQLPSRSEWAYRMTEADTLAGQGLDGGGQVICLVDTGVDPRHPDLAHMRILAWKDFVHGNATPYDDDGHGTAMAGLILSSGSLRGVAPGASLIVAKILDSRGSGTSAGLASAIDFCVDPTGTGNGTGGATIISLSLGAARALPVGNDVSLAVGRAVGTGVFIVASAGNDGLADNGDVQMPASIPEVVAVGSVDSFGAIAGFSSIGSSSGLADPNKKPEIVAPGVDLLTTSKGGGYRLVSGTSASAAFVSGILALLLQGHPSLAHSGSITAVLTIKAALMEGAKKVPGQDAPHDPHYGYGLIDATATLALLP